MADPCRILTQPLRLMGPLSSMQRSLLVSADALSRRATAAGRPAEARTAILTGTLASQAALERELAREGHDRASLGRDAFIERLRVAETEQLVAAADELTGLRADVVLDPTEDERVVRAARTAFVRLYEAGLLELVDRVLDVCPRCETVVAGIDAEPGTIEGERLLLAVGGLELALTAPELLPGAVAVAVPSDHPLAGSTLAMPVVDAELPVLVDPAADAPRLVIPGHHQADLELARAAGLPAALVLDQEGVVRAAGPLEGLARFAARAKARELLAGQGAIAAEELCDEAVARCRRCGTVLIPLLGRHWFLRTAELEVAAADAVREGEVSFTPATARDDFLGSAGLGAGWCLSNQVWGGPGVPVATCLDCGRPSVMVEEGESCNRCMGTLEPDGGALDSRFMGVVWMLATAGWPEEERGLADIGPCTTLLVTPLGLHNWAMPMAALGVWLAGVVPFGQLAVHPDVDVEHVPDEVRGARLALLGADPGLLEALEAPPEGDGDIEAVLEPYDAAFAGGAPTAALESLASLLGEGVPASAADRVRALAAPLLGE